ncbi:MAG TPA: universal stress protein [Candidatus Nanopelagicaceae bacterium]|jgi:nucleotide-binding universal stress UspA family protein
METQQSKSDHVIVVGIDGSDSSKNALRWAVRLAPSLGATIHAIVAWEYPIVFGLEGGVPGVWKPDETAKEILNHTLDSVFGKERPAGFKGSISQGHPTFVLLDASKDAEMLIVGSRGLGGFSGLLLGSVSSSCAERAECPVLVVHGKP